MKKLLTNIVLLIVVIGIALGVRSKFQRFTIPQNGMYPGLPAGTTRWLVKSRFESVDDLNIGDVVVFQLDTDQGKFNYVWRVIAIPGDSVAIENEQIQVNGVTIAREYLRAEGAFEIFEETHGEISYEVAYDSEAPQTNRRGCQLTVPSEHVFLLGDNRYDAADSRYHGPVSVKDVFGKF